MRRIVICVFALLLLFAWSSVAEAQFFRRGGCGPRGCGTQNCGPQGCAAQTTETGVLMTFAEWPAYQVRQQAAGSFIQPETQLPPPKKVGGDGPEGEPIQKPMPKAPSNPPPTTTMPTQGGAPGVTYYERPQRARRFFIFRGRW